jgi:hypothetical protein
MREFNTQLAQKEQELERTVQETIGKHSFELGRDTTLREPTVEAYSPFPCGRCCVSLNSGKTVLVQKVHLSS